MGCLDEETIAAFAETRLPRDAIAGLEAHVRDCVTCATLVSMALAATPGRSVAAGAAGRVLAEPRSVTPAPDAAAALSPGTSVGRYTVLGLVGRGGMGEVYSAYDPELDRKIALKVLNSGADVDDTRGGSRLLREAKAIARLRHPNVVVVHDTGTFASHVFIAMEYVEGQTLAAWLSAQPREQDQILDVFGAAGRGLQAAHAAGLVHRDFKPQNVMVGGDGDVRVMDFGLARAIDATADAGDAADVRAVGIADPALTRTGELVGTPLFMAPEQFAGQRTDARTDQFSFCVALYEALYGVRPFAGKQLAELMAAVADGRIQPPPPRSAVPPRLRKILLRGLATKPDDRFPSMGELLAALGRDPAARRKRRISLAAGAVLVAGLAFGASRLSARQQPTCGGGAARSATAWTPARRVAIEKAFLATGNKSAAQAFAGTVGLLDRYVARWIDQFKETCEATHVRGELSTEVLDLRMACLDEDLANVRALAEILASADAAVVDRAVSAAASLPVLDRCSDVGALRAIVKPPDDEATRRKVADLKDRIAAVKALSAAGRCDEATRLGRPLREAAQAIGYLPLQADASYALGRRYDSCVDNNEALADIEDAFMFAEAARYDEIAIQAAANLATTYANRISDGRAARQWQRVAEAILARFRGHPLLEAYVAGSRAVVLGSEDRREEALYHLQRALKLQEALLGPSSNEVGITVNNIAVALHELGRDEEAETNIRRVADIMRATFGDDTGQLAVVYVNQCEIQTALGKFADAHQAVAKALEIWRRQDAGPFLIGYGLLDLGKLELAERQPARATATLEKSLALLEGQNPRFEAEARFALARALVASSPDNLARAAGLARRARDALRGARAVARLVREIEGWQQEHPAPARSL